MFYPFFELASRSPTRRAGFSRLLLMHLLCVGGAALLGAAANSARYAGTDRITRENSPILFEWLGWTLLIAGIVEGALVLGWRLTQLPKSRSLEPLLLSPTPAWQTMLGEQLVGLTQLAFLSLSTLPIFAILIALGWMEPLQAAVAVGLGFAWGCLVGVGLSWWAFEPDRFRRWGERVILLGTVAFLLFFGLFADRSRYFLYQLPLNGGEYVSKALLWTHQNNPFDLVHRIAAGREPLLVDVLAMTAGCLAIALATAVRSAFRLKGHYIDKNYRPVADDGRKRREPVGDRPVTWWAVRRVNEYPGRVNLYLAGGAAALYALFLVVGEKNWPVMMGRQIFDIYEKAGGVGGFATLLIVLAGVPAAYQYGLWDSSIPERCKRLETFLPTKLDASDYLHASVRASWNRGRGYFLAAALLLIAGYVDRRYGIWELAFAIAAGAVLLAFNFAVAFRYFARSRGNTSLGFLLTVVVPLSVWALGSNGGAGFARMLPPGLVFYATSRGSPPADQFAMLVVFVGIAAYLLLQAYDKFDQEIRSWYDQHQGSPA
jgi:hypothetical protein